MQYILHVEIVAKWLLIEIKPRTRYIISVLKPNTRCISFIIFRWIKYNYALKYNFTLDINLFKVVILIMR